MLRQLIRLGGTRVAVFGVLLSIFHCTATAAEITIEIVSKTKEKLGWKVVFKGTMKLAKGENYVKPDGSVEDADPAYIITKPAQFTRATLVYIDKNGKMTPAAKSLDFKLP